jgi:hypothetical protein
MQYYFSGISNWAKVHDPVPAFDPNKPMEFKIDLIMDDSSWERFDKTGSTLKKRTSPQGEYVTFRRPCEEVDENGYPVPVKVQVLDKNNNPTSDWIGNGSKVTCKVEMFKTKMGTKNRLLSVRVDELVPYESKTIVGADEIESPF